MKLWIIFFIFWIFHPLLHASQTIQDIIDNITGQCNQVNSLLIKKSIIETFDNRENACSNISTMHILNRCKEINCAELISIYAPILRRGDGNVVGN